MAKLIEVELFIWGKPAEEKAFGSVRLPPELTPVAGDVLELNFRRDRMETFSPVLVKERVLTFGPDGALVHVALYVEQYRRS